MLRTYSPDFLPLASVLFSSVVHIINLFGYILKLLLVHITSFPLEGDDAMSSCFTDLSSLFSRLVQLMFLDLFCFCTTYLYVQEFF